MVGRIVAPRLNPSSHHLTAYLPIQQPGVSALRWSFVCTAMADVCTAMAVDNLFTFFGSLFSVV